jgi:hypothetical protein
VAEPLLALVDLSRFARLSRSARLARDPFAEAPPRSVWRHLVHAAQVGNPGTLPDPSDFLPPRSEIAFGPVGKLYLHTA